MSDRKKNIARYVISDYIFSVITWILFFKGILAVELTGAVIVRMLLLSAGWVILYAFAGSYHRSLYEKSRLNELTTTLIYTFIGCMILAAMPADYGINSVNSFITYFILQCLLVFAGRSLLLAQVKRWLL